MKIKVNKYFSVLEKLLDVSSELQVAIDELKDYGLDSATKEDAYFRAKASATIKTKDSGKSQEIRDAFADKGYADARKESFLAKALKDAQLEKVKSLRQVLSALQTYANGSKAEADALHYGQAE